MSASLSGLAALRFAVAEARRRGVGVVMAVRARLEPGPGRGLPSERAELRRRCVAELESAIALAFPVPPADVLIGLLAPAGDPGGSLVRLVRDESDLIVVGSARRWRWGGGVGGYCARHAVCPVVIAPPPAMVGRGRAGGLARSLLRELDLLSANGQTPPRR